MGTGGIAPREAAPLRASARCAPILALLFASGCGLLLDLDPPDDAGVAPRDASSPADGGADAGVDAGSCGDGVVQPDRGEECDESTSTCADCRRVCDCPSIERPCLERIDCVDLECVPQLFPDGTECTRDDERAGECNAGVCIPDRCGDGTLDTGEECDDGNTRSGDGCEADCTFICHSDADCDDGDVCNGDEHCLGNGTGSQLCVAGTPPEIELCAICDPELGPFVPDEDGDGFVADRGQACDARRIDCDDADPGVFPGALEVCNGIDDDCDGARDEDIATVTCALDVDGDGYPGDVAGTMLESCTSCPTGTVPVRASSAGAPLVDCWDVADAFGPMVNPAQTAFFVDPYCSTADARCALPFDYDCDGLEQQPDTRTGPSCDLLSLAGCRGDGWVPPVPACGSIGTYASCDPFLLLACASHRAEQRQACR